MKSKEKILKVAFLGILSFGVVAARVGAYIVTPLWLDYFSESTVNASNITNHSETACSTQSLLLLLSTKNTSHSIGAQFIVLGQWGYSTVVSGVILVWMLLCCPATITRTDRSYPKLNFLIIGFSQAISSVLMTYASSGSRVAPYLQGVLANFNIPVQFTMR